MSVNRRFVLKGMALGGMAGLALGGPAQVLAGFPATPSRPLSRTPALVLVADGAAGACFLRGARQITGARTRVERAGPGLDFILEWERRLQSGQPQRIIGLLDDAAATLVLDLARSSGARVQWLGQHTVTTAASRHRLLNTDLSEGCVEQLSRELQACGAGFSIREERQNSSAPLRRLGQEQRNHSHSGQWASGLGYLLASLGSRPVVASTAASTTSPPVSGSYVSFSIEA